MAKSTPGTAGSKGGGNVVPPRQPTRGGRFGTLGGPGYGPNPLGSAGPRGIVSDDYNRFPRPMPRPIPGYNRYGGMQGPTGLGGFLSRQPAISQRQIDPATGFPARPQSYGAVMGRPDFGSIGRNASKGKSGSKGGARTVRSPDQSRETNRQPQPDIGIDPYGTQTFKIDRDILDRGTVMNPVYRSPADQRLNDEMALREQQSSDRPMMLENPMLFGNNPPPRLTQGLPERPMMQSQGPESLMGEITQSPRFQAMQMGQAGGRPNIRPTMNVGKATGGPVGLASLIGQY